MQRPEWSREKRSERQQPVFPLPKLSRRVRAAAASQPRIVSTLGIAAVEDIPTAASVAAAKAAPALYRVRWGEQKEAEDEQQQRAWDKAEEEQAAEEQDKEAVLCFPSVTVLPSLLSSSSSSVLHSVAQQQPARPLFSKRQRKAAFTSHDFSAQRADPSAEQQPGGRRPRQRRAATAVSSSSASPLRPRVPVLAFSLYQQVVKGSEEAAAESVEVGVSASQLSSPVFSPFASPPLTPYRTPSHAAAASLSSSSSPLFPSPLARLSPAVLPPAASLLEQPSAEWSDFLQWHQLPASAPAKSERLEYCLRQMDAGGALLPATKEALLHWLQAYVRESAAYASTLLSIQQARDELALIAAASSSSSPPAINTLVTFVSLELTLRLLSSSAVLPRATALPRLLPVCHALLSVLCGHMYSHHPHFPSTPYHLHQSRLSASYQAVRLQHADALRRMEDKAEQHRAECRRWQRVVAAVRQHWGRGILAALFTAWRETTRLACCRRQGRRRGQPSEDAEQESAWMRSLRGLHGRVDRRLQLRVITTSWRAQALSSRVCALRDEHNALVASYPTLQLQLASLGERQSGLLSSIASHSALLESRRSHLSLISAQSAAYESQLQEVEAGVDDVQAVVARCFELAGLMAEELEMAAVQLLMGGWQDVGLLVGQGAGGAEQSRQDASVGSQDESERLLAAMGMEPGKLVEQSDRFLRLWLEYQVQQAATAQSCRTASSVAAEPPAASPAERAVLAREQLLRSLRSRSSPSSHYARKTLLAQHFLRGEDMETALRRTGDTACALPQFAPAASVLDGGAALPLIPDSAASASSASSAFPAASLQQYLEALESSGDQQEDDIVAPQPSSPQHRHTRSRVPSSPHVAAMAASMRKGGLLFRSLSGVFGQTASGSGRESSSSMREMEAEAKADAAEEAAAEDAAAAAAGSLSAADIASDGVREERKKKKPALTIQINTQRGAAAPALPTVQSPTADALPALQPAAGVAAVVTPQEAPASAAGSARTRFHRSHLRARGVRSSSVHGWSGAETDSAGWTGRGSVALSPGHSQRLSSTAELPQPPAPLVLSPRPATSHPFSVTAPPALTGSGAAEASPSPGFGSFSCTHNQLIHEGGLIVRPARRSTATLFPVVIQTVDALVRPQSPPVSSASPTLSCAAAESDLQLASIYWLQLLYPALPYRALPLLQSMEREWTGMRRLQQEGATHSRQLGETVLMLSRQRQALAAQRQQAMRRHQLMQRQQRAAEQMLTARAAQLIRQQEREEGLLGGLRARNAAQGEAYTLVSSSSSAVPHHHSHLSNSSGSDAAAEPGSGLPAALPHHRHRSSSAAFSVGEQASLSFAPRTSSSRAEGYTRIRGVIASLLQSHGRPKTAAAPAVKVRAQSQISHRSRLQRAKSSSLDSRPAQQRSLDLTPSTLPRAIPEAPLDEDDVGPTAAGERAAATAERQSKDTAEAGSRSAAAAAAGAGDAASVTAAVSEARGLSGDVSELQRCERILGHFHHDLRRIFRHAIDSDLSNQHKTTQLAPSAATLASGAAGGSAGSASLPSLTKHPSEQSTMTGLQWLRFVRQYRLWSVSLSAHAIDLLYAVKLELKQAVYESVMRQAGSVDVLNYDDFLELLCTVAAQRDRDEEDVSVRLWRLFDCVLFPSSRSIAEDYRVLLSISGAQWVLDKHALWLQSVYASYASAAFVSRSLYRLHDAHSLNVYSINTLEERAMTRLDWQQLIADSSLQSLRVVSADAAELLWSQAQQDMAGEDYFGGGELMVYAEFQEALCALSAYFDRSPVVSVESKLDAMLSWLQSVQEMEERRHQHAVWMPGQTGGMGGGATAAGSALGLTQQALPSTTLPLT